MALRAEFYCWMLHSKMSKLRSILQYILNSYISFYNNTFIYIYIYIVLVDRLGLRDVLKQ